MDGGQVSVSTAGTHDAGNIEISADNVSVSGVDPRVDTGNPADVFAQSNTPPSDPSNPDGSDAGRVGNITITARENLMIADGGLVSVETASDIDAGVITLAAGRALELASGGTISAVSKTGAQGKGGSIVIKRAELVSLTGGSAISASTFGSIEGGSIKIKANELVSLSGGSEIRATSLQHRRRGQDRGPRPGASRAGTAPSRPKPEASLGGDIEIHAARERAAGRQHTHHERLRQQTPT